MSRTITRVAVIGAGTMGGGIAAHFANAGFQVDLLDVPPPSLTPDEEKRGLTLDSPAVRNRFVNGGWDRVKKSRPAALFTADTAERVRLGKETVTEQETVGGEVRREEIELDRGDSIREAVRDDRS